MAEIYVHINVDVVQDDAHHDGYERSVEPENFMFLSWWMAEIYVHINVDVVQDDAHHNGYDGWVDPEHIRFIP